MVYSLVAPCRVGYDPSNMSLNPRTDDRSPRISSDLPIQTVTIPIMPARVLYYHHVFQIARYKSRVLREGGRHTLALLLTI